MKQPSRILQVALSSPLRRLFDYRIDTDETIMPGSRVAVPFGHQKSIMGIVVSETFAPSQHTLRPIQSVLDDEPVLDHEILTLCQWCADYYHHPMGDICHTALPALLRKPEAMPTPLIKAWRLSAYGQEREPDELNRAPKQKQALLYLKEHTIASVESINNAGIHSSTLTALAKKQLAEKIDILPERIDGDLVEPSGAEHPLALLGERALDLNQEQQHALEKINFEHFNTLLLDGVTGSGKTEVYLQAIAKVLQQKKRALVLIPEIGLTPQTLSRFQKRFSCKVACLHSGLSDKERLGIWRDAREGRIAILIGTRSSIFTPLPDLGLIIIDEEHDLSYKQQEGLRYSARDLAIVRAKNRNIPLILGSATPSLESLQNALSGRYALACLRQRAQQAAMPHFECVDGQEQQLHPQIHSAIQQTLNENKQVLVFINRRGYAPTLSCQDCGWICMCHNCDSRLTVHHRHNHAHANKELRCHHCDAHQAVPNSCPQCRSRRLQNLGAGTQRSEEMLEQAFSAFPILRIDRDSVAKKGQLETALNTINQGKPCIIVGTQMLAKGHHFSQLGLGVILGLDQGFFSSDFRGAERMGQLLTQVAGRVGREKTQAKVLIQTRFGDHPLLQLLLNQGYGDFARHLLAERQLSAMPPFQHIACLRCHAQQASLAEKFLLKARQIAETIAPPHNTLSYLGPFPASIEKRNNRYHYLLQIKAANRKERQHVLQALCLELERSRTPKGLHWLIDVDAQEF